MMWIHEGEHLDMVQMGDILLGMLYVCLRGKMACVREKLTGGSPESKGNDMFPATASSVIS